MVVITEPELLIEQPPCLRRPVSQSSRRAQEVAQPTISKSYTSFLLVPCGDDIFWTSCWDSDASSVDDDIVTPKSQAKETCLSMNGVECQRSGSYSDPAPGLTALTPARILKESSPKSSLLQSHRGKDKSNKVNKSVIFSEASDYCESEEGMTDAERERYFWTEADARQFKEERRFLLNTFKAQYKFNGATFWDDNTMDSIRGLEDYSAELLGHRSCYFVRREHERRVLNEFFDQYSYGYMDSERLREASLKSSVKSSLRALDKARGDAANTHSAELYQCPAMIETTSIWSDDDSDKNSDFS